MLSDGREGRKGQGLRPLRKAVGSSTPSYLSSHPTDACPTCHQLLETSPDQGRSETASRISNGSLEAPPWRNTKDPAKPCKPFPTTGLGERLLRMWVKYTGVRALARLFCLLPHLSTGRVSSEMGSPCPSEWLLKAGGPDPPVWANVALLPPHLRQLREHNSDSKGPVLSHWTPAPAWPGLGSKEKLITRSLCSAFHFR